MARAPQPVSLGAGANRPRILCPIVQFSTIDCPSFHVLMRSGKRVITLDWAVDARSEWQGLLAGARCALQQGWSYGEALRTGGMRVAAGILRDDASRTAVGCLQIASRRLFGPCGAAFL